MYFVGVIADIVWKERQPIGLEERGFTELMEFLFNYVFIQTSLLYSFTSTLYLKEKISVYRGNSFWNKITKHIENYNAH